MEELLEPVIPPEPTREERKLGEILGEEPVFGVPMAMPAVGAEEHVFGDQWQSELRAMAPPQIVPPFYDPSVDHYGSLSADLVVPDPQLELLSGNPNDPKLELDALSPAWFVSVISLISRVALPFANARLVEAQPANVDVDVYYSIQSALGFRVPGVIVANRSRKRILVHDALIEAGGNKLRLQPRLADDPIKVLYVPHGVEPGGWEVFTLQSGSVCPTTNPYIEIRLRLSADGAYQTPAWRLWANGNAEIIE